MYLHARERRESDNNFIIHSMVRSYYDHSSLGTWLPFNVFKIHYRAHLLELLPAAEIIILCDKEDQDYILAFKVSTEEPEFSYTYVKQAFRAHPVIEQLFSTGSTECTTKSM